MFEFLHDLVTHEEHYVVRAQHDRLLSKDNKLFTAVEKEAVTGKMTTLIHHPDTREIKEITLSLKSLKSVFLPPTRHLPKDRYEALTTNIVMVYNDDYCWYLLTDLPVETLADCEEVVNIYKSRWHIEDFHKVLKTGYQIDELYIHSSRQAIISALALMSLSACRLYWLIYVGRVDPDCKAEDLFQEHEWKTPYIYLKEEIPGESPPLAEVIIKIARMGGYKVQKKGSPPGIKSMWLGLQALDIAAEMYKNILPIKT